jgi:phage shock protein PspC (stress-responsive transcriptional regulator)
MTTYEQSTGSPECALYRPAHGRIVAGVAAGVAEYLGVDTALVRIAFVVLTFMGGLAIPAYLAAWVLMPGEGAPSSALEQWLAEHR